MRVFSSFTCRLVLGFGLLLPAALGGLARAADVDALAAENRDLRARLDAVERELQALREELAAWRPARAPDAGTAPTASARPAVEPAPVVPVEPPPVTRGGVERVVFSGELAVAYFDSQRDGLFPAGQFRVDDAKLYLDAEVRRGLYAFVEFDVALRENEEEFRLGEIYLELENLGARVGLDGWATLRLGRLDIPFGEEYLARHAFENPLISHSLADFWGVDEGVELYGGRGPWSYVLAVQNGSRPSFTDFTSDKSVTLRVAVDAAPRLRLGASAMRTGEIEAVEERLSELWWGGGFLRSIGGTATTTVFSAELLQVDGALRWRNGQLKAAAGLVRYDDDDTAADNRRTLRHAMLEARQGFGPDLFAAARYSVIDADAGYPIGGQGDLGRYFFSPNWFTDDVWRLSLGLGYRLAPDFLLKFEYSFERGTFRTGAERRLVDQVATQAAVRF